MSKCTGCATYINTFKGDSTRCLLEKSDDCVCITCLIKMICQRKLECMPFCRQALTIHNAHNSGFIRCLKNMFPEMYKELMNEQKIKIKESKC
jgi:hypothetical protein